MYEGLFDDFVRVDEQQIAQRAETDRDRVIRQLQWLQRRGVLEYKPASDMPQLAYTHERLPADELLLSVKDLNARKERYRRRASFMLSYASSLHRCRSLMLLKYFGEKEAGRCGQCDFCRERNKLELNDLEYEALAEKVRALTIGRTLTVSGLLTGLGAGNENKALLAIRWMIDNHQLHYKSEGELAWSGE
jgi:ATP-dependent DNA helicase RecQ